MNLQYLSDNMGHTTAVQLQIPIEEWELMKSKYKEFEEHEIDVIPDWHLELVKQEVKKIENGTAELMDWKEAKKEFRF